MFYKFALNINDDNNSLSQTHGLDFGDFGVLIKHLHNALNDDENCTLYKVDNHGYTPHFITASKNLYENFIEVHKNIYEKGITDLNGNEATYANTLKKILKDNKYIEALDNDNRPIQRIYPSEIERAVESYFVVKNQTGVISEIGSPTLEKTSHIYLHGVDYKVFITEEQDRQLKQYYKGATLELKIKQRRSIKTAKVINAQLLKFTVKSNATLDESTNELTKDDLPFLNDIQSHEDIIRLIRS